MSKEYLEALEKIEEVLDSYNITSYWFKELDNIKQALQRLNAIENSNPSEAIKCLEEICNDKTIHDYILYNCLDEGFTTVIHSLLKVQDLEKENAYIEKLLQVIKQEFKLELYAMCKRRLELATNANRDNLEKILEWLKKEE